MNGLGRHWQILEHTWKDSGTNTPEDPRTHRNTLYKIGQSWKTLPDLRAHGKILEQTQQEIQEHIGGPYVRLNNLGKLGIVCNETTWAPWNILESFCSKLRGMTSGLTG